MSWARIFRLLGLAGVVLLITSAFTPLPNILARWLSIPPRLERAEAIVVLGGKIEPDGKLNNASLRRALHGIVLHRKGLAPLLVFFGSDNSEGFVEAEVRAELAHELGISSEMILTEAEARTTRDEAVRAEVLLRPMGVQRILLVTDSQHMARARGLFERGGFEVLAAPADDFSNSADKPDERLRLMRRILKELLARIYYRVAGYL